MAKILIRSPNWLGDVVMTLPAVRHVVESSGAEVSVLAPPKLAEVWHLIRGVRDIIPVQPGVRETATALKPHRFDQAIIFPNSLRTGLEALLAGIPERVAFAGHWRRLLLKRVVPRPVPKEGFRHQMCDYLDLVAAAGYPAKDESEPRFPEIQPPEKAAVEGFENTLAVCPGAEYGPAKRWLPGRFAACARSLAQEHGLHIVLLGAPVDIPACDAVEQALQAEAPSVPCSNLAGRTSLGEFIAHIARARAILCNDSGSMHLAALLGTPGVAIFGSTEQRLTGPIGPAVRPVRHHVSCSPCFLRECPLDFRCMERISSDEVLEQMQNALTL